MSYNQGQTIPVPVKLANGTIIQIEVLRWTGREDVSSKTLPFKQVTEAIQEIVEAQDNPRTSRQ